MRFFPSQTDDAILAQLGESLAQSRLRKRLTQDQLAREAGVSKRTVLRIERGESIQLTNLIRILRTLNLLHALDSLKPQPSPIEQLRGTRVRVRPSRSEKSSNPNPPRSARNPSGNPPANPPTKRTWMWGDEKPSNQDRSQP